MLVAHHCFPHAASAIARHSARLSPQALGVSDSRLSVVYRVNGL